MRDQIQGSDAADTAARQYVGFNRLESVWIALVGDRLVANETTEAERALRTQYHDAYLSIQADFRASLPESERAYEQDTQYGKWRGLVDTYWADQEFTRNFFQIVLPRDFLEAYGQAYEANVADIENPWVPGFADETAPTSSLPTNVIGSLIFLGLLMLVGLGWRRRRYVVEIN